MAKWETCVIAGALLGLAGCAAWVPECLDMTALAVAGEYANQRFLVGLPEEVCGAVESVLLNLGMTVVSSPYENGIRISATTAKGERFDVFLSRDRMLDEEANATCVTIGGLSRRREHQVLVAVDALNRK
jgi:hypothetical protein